MASILSTKTFWQEAFERATKTFAQVLLALITAQAVGLTTFDWKTSASVAGMSAIASVLTSIVSAAPGPGQPPNG